jgi:O-antigen biosynthesis protein WbqL
MLPRLLVARRALGSSAGEWGLLLERATPAWFRKILLEVLRFDESSFEFYDPRTEGVKVRYAAIPTLTSFDGWYHPFTNDIIEDVVALAGAHSAGPTAPRVMISRALFSNPATMSRRCTNELKLAEIAAKEFGFAIVANETFPWATQVDLFHKAEIIVGEFGSGLHNALFAKAGARIGSIGIHSLAQSMIGALRGHQNAYLRTARDANGYYTIDEDLFRRFLAAVTGDATG